MKIHISTFGCKVNLCDSELIREILVKKGYKIVENVQNSDLVIINSCTVTNESDKKIKRFINKLKKNNQNLVVLLTGCIAQANTEVAKQFENVDIIVGNTDKQKILDSIQKYSRNHKKIIDIDEIQNAEKFENIKINKFVSRTRVFLKIEDGCNNFCSYCTIPYARGKARSKPIESIQDDLFNLAKNGFKEVVLVGINLSAYGQDTNSNFDEIFNIINKIPEIKRVRFGSLEPNIINRNFVRMIQKNDKICPCFHLSLQSGSNKILKSMRRKYTQEQFIENVQMIREYIQNSTITTDLIVGFPGETEADFEQSLDIIKELRFLKVHVFPYSTRKNTAAEKFENQISKVIKTQRVKSVIEVAELQRNEILTDNLKISHNVLYETIDKNGYHVGYTSNYIPVKTKIQNDVRGEIIKTKLVSIHKNFCFGEIIL